MGPRLLAGVVRKHLRCRYLPLGLQLGRRQVFSLILYGPERRALSTWLDRTYERVLSPATWGTDRDLRYRLRCVSTIEDETTCTKQNFGKCSLLGACPVVRPSSSSSQCLLVSGQPRHLPTFRIPPETLIPGLVSTRILLHVHLLAMETSEDVRPAKRFKVSSNRVSAYGSQLKISVASIGKGGS